MTTYSLRSFGAPLLIATLLPLWLGAEAQAQSGRGTTRWNDALVQAPAWYASDEAIRIADNVLVYQHETGGWPKNIDMARVLSEADRERIREEQAEGGTTLSNISIDNGATYSQMRYLAWVYEATGLERFKEGVLRGMDYLLEAQYDNGGWPQYYPLREGYYDRITFNDGAMIGALRVLRDIAAGEPPFTFVRAERRAEAEAALARGIDAVLRMQIRQNGRLAAWCAQYDEETLEPAWARDYEPPSLSGSESVGVVRFLMSLEGSSPAIVNAIEGATAWFRKVAIHGHRFEEFVDEEGREDKRIVRNPDAGPLWARFYELVTNRPIFLGRNSVFRYSLSEIEQERRAGYDYYGDWAEELLEEEYPAWRSRFADRIRRTASPTSPHAAPARDSATLIASAGGRTLAFPGAEGYGKYTRGGRGGTVYEVTNLQDAGPGSLRAAVEASGPRTVVFRVSGTIDLESPLTIRNPYLTIAGQTAPGDGIAIKDHPIVIGADEVIIRYVRVRLGDQTDSDADAISARYVKNIILDHVSASWSIDETMSVYHADSVTVQWSLVSESLYDTHHEKGAHGFGGIWGGNRSTYHHNLLAHHSSRNPRFASGCGYTDYRNNVIFNWGYNSAYGGEKSQPNDPRFDFCTINVVANYYKPGPATIPGKVTRRIASPSSRDGVNGYGKWYVADNVVYGNAAVTAGNWDGGVQPQDSSHIRALKLDAPFASMPVDQQDAEAAYASVLDNVGATLPRRDTLDARIVDETRNGYATYEGGTYEKDHAVADPARKSGIIDSQADVGGWPELRSTPAPTDTDHDGMPDDWEVKMGLDPKDAADRNRVGADGYTMLEKYLNRIEFDVPVQNVRTVRKSGTVIEVRWADTYLAEEGFRIERSVNGGPYKILAEVSKNVTFVVDDSVNGTDEYAYRVSVKPNDHVKVAVGKEP